jgi:HflK protein
LNFKAKKKKLMQQSQKLWLGLKKLSLRFWQKTKVFLLHFHNACNEAMKHVVIFSKKGFSKIKPSQKSRRKFALLFYVALFLLLFISVSIIFLSYVFTVPVGSSAVVTRFGKYSRKVDSGFHFRFPLVERYFIVDTSNLMEETFGFLQRAVPVVDPETTLDPAVVEYDKRIIAAEQTMGSALAENANIFDSLNQRQRLPFDYLKKKFLPATIAPLTGPRRLGQTQSNTIPNEDEQKMISADLNIINISWSLQYKINNPRDYLFNSRDVARNIRDIAQTMMSKTVGDTLFMPLLNEKREFVEQHVKQEIQKWLDKYRVGIKIEQVIILDALPPTLVIDAFNEVNSATQVMERMIYEAEIEYLKVVPAAFGEAKKIVFIAEGEAIQLINQALGEAGRFEKILGEYTKYRQITNDRLYIEAMNALFSKVPNTIIDNKINGVLPVFLGGTETQHMTPQLLKL